jgi:hypothetical protein
VRYIATLRKDEGRYASAQALAKVVANVDHPQRDLAIPFYISDLARSGDDVRAVLLGEDYLTSNTLSDSTKAAVARVLFSVYTQFIGSVSGASRMRSKLRDYGHIAFETGVVDKELSRLERSQYNTSVFGKNDAVDAEPGHPLDIEIDAYPNPFSHSATIAFTLERPGRISLAVYDIVGREVQRLVDAPLYEGVYHFKFTPGIYLAQGLYFYRFETEGRSKVGKLIYVK